MVFLLLLMWHLEDVHDLYRVAAGVCATMATGNPRVSISTAAVVLTCAKWRLLAVGRYTSSMVCVDGRGVKGLWCVRNADSTKSLPRKRSHWRKITTMLHLGRDNLLVERRTRNRKVASSNAGRSGGRIFFSTVNLVCWLLFCIRKTSLKVGRPHETIC